MQKKLTLFTYIVFQLYLMKPKDHKIFVSLRKEMNRQNTL